MNNTAIANSSSTHGANMCGILVIHGPHIDLNTANNALATLAHRGPDGHHHWFSRDDALFMGHHRLSLVDLHGGQQPLLSEDGKIVAVVNGEFYDHQKLRGMLEQRGHRFSTHTDSECLIHLYEDEGLDALRWLRGEFAFVLWDGHQQKLIFGRDRFGIKPLVYTKHNDQWLIASEAKALFAAGAPKQLDTQALFQCAHLHYTLPTQTMFQNIYQCAPGHVMVLSQDGLNAHKYWDFDYPTEPQNVSEEDAIEQFKSLLDDAVRVRLQADVEVGCYLSGGLDSCGVLGLAMQHRTTPIKCFTLCFDDDAYNEQAIATQMAAHAGADLHLVHCSRPMLLEHFDRAIYHAEGIVINGHLTAKYLLSQAAQQAGVTAVLAGEGADEITAGYPHLRQDLLKQNPQALQSLFDQNTVAQGIFLAHGDGLDLRAIQNTMGFTPSFLEAKASLGKRISSLLHPDFVAHMGPQDPYHTMLAQFDVANQLQHRHPVHQSMYLWSKLSLANYILRMIGDSTEMAHSIEGRLPFLDHHLVEFVVTLPMSLKIKQGIEKYIQREATKHVLTPTVYRRQKHALLTPPSNTNTTAMIQTRLTQPAFTSLPYFDHDAIQNMLQTLDEHTPKQRAILDPMLMFLMSVDALHRTLL